MNTGSVTARSISSGDVWKILKVGSGLEFHPQLKAPLGAHVPSQWTAGDANVLCYLPNCPAREHARVASQAFYFAATWTYEAGHVTRPGTKPGKEQVARYMPRLKCFGHSAEVWDTSPGARPLPR